MTPPPDKIRELVEIGCKAEGCEFRTTQEWAAFRHEAENPGHLMAWWDCVGPVASAAPDMPWPLPQLSPALRASRVGDRS